MASRKRANSDCQRRLFVARPIAVNAAQNGSLASEQADLADVAKSQPQNLISGWQDARLRVQE